MSKGIVKRHDECENENITCFVAAKRLKKENECCSNCKYGGRLEPWGYIPDVCTKDNTMIADAGSCICGRYKRKTDRDE